MGEDNNFLLVGNSRLHWAENLSDNFRFFHTQMNDKVPKSINLNNLIWASVGKIPDLFLKQENQIKTRDIYLKNLPDYFGVDRALGCLEALKIIENPFQKNLLIADCGTTLSLTKITAKGSIIGGQIIPGFLTQLRSMDQYTENLKVPKKFDIPIQDFTMKTEEAMLKGVYNSLVGVINLSFNPTNDILIMCGGDSELIGSGLKKKYQKIIITPNLVMQGMISHFNHKNI
tara:strand:+ start:183 stop:872 length:690 start_codon:yes stop_codon:yes gene_type:complete